MLVPVQQYLTRERPQLAKEEKVWRMHLKLILCVQNIGAMCFLITTMTHDAEAGCKAAESWLAPGLFMSSSHTCFVAGCCHLSDRRDAVASCTPAWQISLDSMPQSEMM